MSCNYSNLLTELELTGILSMHDEPQTAKGNVECDSSYTRTRYDDVQDLHVLVNRLHRSVMFTWDIPGCQVGYAGCVCDIHNRNQT